MAQGRPPDLSSEVASLLITQSFPFKNVFTSSFKSLPSYYDRNIYFEGVRETESCEETRFVLKISHSDIASDIIDGLNAMMLYLNKKGFPNCCPIASRGGSYAVAVSENQLLGKDKESAVKYAVRILTYIAGEVMDEVEKQFMTPELSYSVGCLAGRMDLELQVITASLVSSNLNFLFMCRISESLP